MKAFYISIVLLLFFAPLHAQEGAEEPVADDETEMEEENYEPTSNFTTYYFIRHAEKDRSDPNDKDPHLTQAGLLRSAKWSLVLADIKFDMVYSTDYHRTRETAQPVAETNGLEISIYDPRELDMKGFIGATLGKTVLVVGHSNTTPAFVNKLIGEGTYEQMEDDDNASLYIVNIAGNGEKSHSLLRIN